MYSFPFTSQASSVAHSGPSPNSSHSNALIQSASSSRVPLVCCSAPCLAGTHSPTKGFGEPFFQLETCLYPLSLHNSFHPTVSHSDFLPVSSFLIFNFFLFFLLFLTHLLRTDKYWAAHPNSIYMKCDSFSVVWQACCVPYVLQRWQNNLPCQPEHYEMEIVYSLGFFKNHFLISQT